MEENKQCISIAEIKLMQDLYKIEEDVWFMENFYNVKFTQEEFFEYVNKKLNNGK